ncbi:MAG: cytochrome c oxidase subunit II, partial [Novosphingobium sp.]|nr:cytochrome c oxidase subunit II [Novosphingobium sp.]
MEFGKQARAACLMLKALGLSLALLVSPHLAGAAAPSAPQVLAGSPAVAAAAPAASAAADAAATPEGAASGTAAAPSAGFYQRMKPTEGKGMPRPGELGTQEQYSPLGQRAAWVHNDVLLPIIAVISLFVLVLLLIVMVRFNRRANPVASRTSHNTLLEVVWTLVPVLILVGIAVPSIDLLAKQFKPAPEGALTIKATGNQWFWTYSYPDNGEFEIVSNMLNPPGYPVINNGVRE